MHPSQLTGDGTLADGLNFEGEPRHPTLSPRGCMVAAGAQCGMAPLSCKIEATCECPVTCELRWMHLSLSSTKNIGGPSRTGWVIADLLRPATLGIALMLNVAGLSRSATAQPVRDGPPIFLVELKDKCILRSSHVARHSQVASLLQENRAMLH